MHPHSCSKKRPRLGSPVRVSLVACSLLLYTPMGFAQGASGQPPGRETASPIKHVMIIVGENRSFEHLFATYVPHNHGEAVQNLLSEGIVTTRASSSRRISSAQARAFQ
jgi:phospholipase C